MTEKSQKQMIQEVHQAVLGIPDTEDNGLVGDFKELKEAVGQQNGRQRKTDKKVNITIGVLLCLSVLGGSIFGLTKWIGG